MIVAVNWSPQYMNLLIIHESIDEHNKTFTVLYFTTRLFVGFYPFILNRHCKKRFDWTQGFGQERCQHFNDSPPTVFLKCTQLSRPL